MGDKPDPMTHLHSERDMEYHAQRASCSACGRTWRVWDTGKGFLMWITEPRFPRVGKNEPRLRPKRTKRT